MLVISCRLVELVFRWLYFFLCLFGEPLLLSGSFLSDTLTQFLDIYKGNVLICEVTIHTHYICFQIDPNVSIRKY